MRRRRDVEGISLSFLDVISCGFGAVILLLVITKVFEPVIIEEMTTELDGLIRDMQEQLAELKGQTDVLNRQYDVTEVELAEAIARLSKTRADLSSVEGKFDDSTKDAFVAGLIEGKLAAAQQELSEEMKRLLGPDFRRKQDDNAIGGIPVDSEYVIFIIDTSGSMFNFSWDLMIDKVAETLEIYPKVKGIQVMNDMGRYMFSRYSDRWIPDTPARRRAIVERLRTWNAFSNSSPVEGINKAISTFWAPDRRISLYVFGDEFTGGSIQRVLDTVARINRA